MTGKRAPISPKKPEHPILSVNPLVEPKGFFDYPVFTDDGRIIEFRRFYTENLMPSSGVLTNLLKEQAEQAPPNYYST